MSRAAPPSVGYALRANPAYVTAAVTGQIDPRESA